MTQDNNQCKPADLIACTKPLTEVLGPLLLPTYRKLTMSLAPPTMFGGNGRGKQPTGRKLFGLKY